VNCQYLTPLSSCVPTSFVNLKLAFDHLQKMFNNVGMMSRGTFGRSSNKTPWHLSIWESSKVTTDPVFQFYFKLLINWKEISWSIWQTQQYNAV
jgi:hypothetical protein